MPQRVVFPEVEAYSTGASVAYAYRVLIILSGDLGIIGAYCDTRYFYTLAVATANSLQDGDHQ